jgi:hypothetical protein
MEIETAYGPTDTVQTFNISFDVSFLPNPAASSESGILRFDSGSNVENVESKRRMEEERKIPSVIRFELPNDFRI